MGPPLRHANCDGLEALPGPSSRKRLRAEDSDATSIMGVGAKISQYSHVSASHQARQHIGDVFHGPVTLQHLSTTPPTAPGAAKEVERNSFMEWLVFNEMDARFIDVHSHLVGTCDWLPTTPEYRNWMDPRLISTHHGFLWIKGKAGAGKSTLMKYASAHADARCLDHQHVLNFFFHARGGSFETSMDGLFRSLLHQLLEKIPRLYDTFDKRRLGLVKRQGWSTALLKDTFREAVMSLELEKVICFIDAMDECRHSDMENIVRFFDDLEDALMNESKQFYICLSSRHYPNLRSNKSIELVLEIQQGHDEDIWQYIQRRLMIDSKTLKNNLARTIKFKAYGVFLWVVLVVALVNQDDRNGKVQEIYDRLSQIPTELSDLFNELIERGAYSEHLRPLLQWVAFSRRPLTPAELYCILMCSASKTGSAELAIERTNLAKFILHASKGLVETTPGMHTRVQFIHESLRTYFLGEGVAHLTSHVDADRSSSDTTRTLEAQELATNIARCHDQLRESCQGYIKQLDIVPSPAQFSTDSARTSMHDRGSAAHLFFEYAVYGVMSHANSALKYGLPQGTLIDTLPWSDLGALHKIVRGKGLHCSEANVSSWYKAYVAAIFGCPRLLKAILETLSQTEVAALHWSKLLHASTKISDFECASIILQAGADPNARAIKGPGSCLRYAITRAFNLRYEGRPFESPGWNIVELLLKHGARPYATGNEKSDCIYEACDDNDMRGLRILLGDQLKADTRCSEYRISLACAVGRASRIANDAILDFLLDKGAETGLWPRAKDNNWDTYCAVLEVTFGEMSIVRLILAERPRVVPRSKTSFDSTLRFMLKAKRLR